NSLEAPRQREARCYPAFMLQVSRWGRRPNRQTISNLEYFGFGTRCTEVCGAHTKRYLPSATNQLNGGVLIWLPSPQANGPWTHLTRKQCLAFVTLAFPAFVALSKNSPVARPSPKT